jgi:hypothetical protein
MRLARCSSNTAIALLAGLLGATSGCGGDDPFPQPQAATFTVGGSVTDLKGHGLVLRNNGADDLAIESGGSFTFQTPLEDGASYAVTIAAQPSGQTCSVKNGEGTVAGGDITSVAVSCEDGAVPTPTRSIGGTVTGLKGKGLVLQNNGEGELAIEADGPFAFPNAIEEGKGYSVTVAVQPSDPAQLCLVTGGAGTAQGDDVTDVIVKCGVDPKLVDVTNASRCDFLDASYCLFPFPNDVFTAADPTTATGLRVNLDPASMPVNTEVDASPLLGAPPGTLVLPGGITLNPSEWNRNDGFSPGQMILTLVPGLDLAATGAGPITYMERSLEPDAPILIIDAETGERHLSWAEMDSYATEDASRALIIRAGINFKEGRRYIVALRNLKNKDGAILEPSAAFHVYRDAVPSEIPEIEARRERMEDIFGRLAGSGVAREELYLAWDFTVASGRSLSERMLHIRDDAFASLGAAAPAFTVTKVTQNPDANRSRRIEGTFTVPNYMTSPSGASGSAFYYADPDDGLPDRMNGSATLSANFICNVPRSTLIDGLDQNAAVTPGRAALYGHGQQGNASQVNGGSATGELSNLYNFVFCATDFIGMSSSDDLSILQMIADFSKFNTLADRLQQGLLNNLYLARLMIHPQGFISDAAFRGGQGDSPLINTADVFYYGISQGGILGGALIAVSQDIRRGVLGVPGMNYSILLDRATGFDTLRPIMDAAYPKELDRRFIFSIMQMLWDRGETNGYAQHLTHDPLPSTPPHDVLLHVAFGDHQVTHWSADIEARTIGASIHAPPIGPGRSEDKTPYFGIPAIKSYPFFGSAMIVWDTGPFDPALNVGTPPPPVENQPPRDGVDPHGKPRTQPGARLQISEFLKSTGKVIDACAGEPCFAK